MKKTSWCFLSGLLTLMILSLNSAPVLAQEDNGIGDWASEAAPREPHGVPVGHYATMAGYADEYFMDAYQNRGYRVLFAKPLLDGSDDPAKLDEITDFFLLDIREVWPTAKNPQMAYCNNHLPGAVNIPYQDVFKPRNLAQLPSDRPILVICYTGHGASQVTSVLNMLGYDAWILRFGMMGVTPTTMMRFGSVTETPQAVHGAGYGVYQPEICQSR